MAVVRRTDFETYGLSCQSEYGMCGKERSEGQLRILASTTKRTLVSFTDMEKTSQEAVGDGGVRNQKFWFGHDQSGRMSGHQSGDTYKHMHTHKHVDIYTHIQAKCTHTMYRMMLLMLFEEKNLWKTYSYV